MTSDRLPVCDYEGSNYQESFWEHGGRAYEDGVEAVALERLLPPDGELLLEVGAGAGRNTPRYRAFQRIVLLDYSLTQLQQAQARLGRSERYVYVAADVYRMPFAPGLFDAATMIRVLHHMSEPQKALQQIRAGMRTGGIFILEYANKRNLKAILRYFLRQQDWNPFARESVEFAPLNFDFHPAAVRHWLGEAGFILERQLTVSHFRMSLLKRLLPVRLLVWLDSLAQFTGNWWQLTPSVFARSRVVGEGAIASSGAFFRCPECGAEDLEGRPDRVICLACRKEWLLRDGIYDFRNPVN